MRIEYDAESNISYGYLRRTPSNVHKTLELTDSLMIDVDAEGNVLGIECLYGMITHDVIERVLRLVKVQV